MSQRVKKRPIGVVTSENDRILHRRKVRGVSYPIETRTASLIEAIGGEYETRSAYYEGDWTTVQAKMDRALGEHTFEKMMILLGHNVPGNIRAGKYEDDFACFPIQFLAKRYRRERDMRKIFNRVTRRDLIWNRSRSHCGL
jgi:hypothetical protein